MALFAADEDDSAFDIVGGVQYEHDQSVHKVVEKSDMTRHKRVVSKWTSSRRLSLFNDQLGIEG